MGNKDKLRSIYHSLPDKTRMSGVKVIAWVVMRSLLNFIGMASVLSVIYFLIKKEYMDYIALVISLCAIVLLLKMVALHYIDKYCMYWYLSIYKYLSSSVLHKYYKCGLLFIRKKGIADLTYNTNGVCYTFATMLIPSILQSIGNLCLVTVFMIGFLIYSPMVALLFMFFACILIIINVRFVGKNVSLIGKEEIAAKKEQWKIVQDCFSGYADMEMNQAFPLFEERFKKGMDVIIDCQYQMKKKREIPVFLSEITILALLTTVLFLSNSTEELIMLLGAISVGAFKILPSLKQIISGWNTLQNQIYSTDILYDALNFCVKPMEKSVVAVFEDKVVLKNICFSYDNTNTVLTHINMSFKKGERVGIQGVSGLGKTTLLNILLGFIVPDRGQVLLDGEDLVNINLQTWHNQIGYVPQEVFIADASVVGNIAFGIPHKKIDMIKIYEVLKIVELYDWAKSLPRDINTRIGEDGCLVSCGQKQRIGIARALYKGAKVLILDEATSSLDNTTERNILDIVYELTGEESERTLIMVSHNESSMKECDRIISL